jgi:hypothetical protein
MILSWLTDPPTRGLDLDDPWAVIQRKRTLEEQVFLKELYRKWFDLILCSLGEATFPVFEVCRGPGFSVGTFLN